VTTPEPTPKKEPSLEEKAEEVRAYLVAVRGGAPFLSAADGRLLVRWLERGFSVARILAGVDETAEKRRKKMTRGRLTLTACRRGIEGRTATKVAEKTENSVQQTEKTIDFSGLMHALGSMDVSPSLQGARNHLLGTLEQLNGTCDLEHGTTFAVTACRKFQEAAWNDAQHEHHELRTQALEELSALKNVLNPAALEAAVEEVARDLVRRRFPLVSAREVWDRVSAV